MLYFVFLYSYRKGLNKTPGPNHFPPAPLLRWIHSVVGSVAGGGEARGGQRMPQAVRVLPHAHDGQLPVPELDHSAGWSAV